MGKIMMKPSMRFESLRMLIALAVQSGLKLHQLDITTAFLNGEFKEEVYMKQPEEYAEKRISFVN